MNKNYDANSIEVLDGLDAIRKRPDMYVGATTGRFSPALYRILREVIDNSLDEFLGGHSKSLFIFMDTKSNSVTVIDDGRGIPTGMNDKLGMDALTAVFTKVHSGGKFDHVVYKTSSGKNGVGITALNALSEWLVAFSNNNKTKTWMCQRFKRGIADGGLTAAKIPSEFKSCIKKTGTIVQFKPDSQIFKDGIEMDIARLKRELRDIQYLCPKLNIQLNIDGQVTSYYSETGLTELVCDGKEYEHVFSYTAENIDAAIAFTKKDGSSFKSYVNIVYTDMGGTHLAGFKKIICDIVKENSKKDIASDDILEGMVGAIHYKMAEPQYQSQTKNELTSVEAKKDVMDLLEQPLRKFFRKNKDLLDRIVKYAEKMYAEKQKMKANKDLLKGLKTINSAARYISEKFLDADRRKYRNVGDLEMFVVEGDSAGGHFSKAREGFQACLKLRGKIINAAKASDADLFGSSKKGSEKDGNREIKDLTAALGCGVLDQYNERNLRFGKLIIMTDADSDGCHITNLVLAFLVKYMPDLIKNGHVYTIDAPLFMANGPSFRVYGMSRNEVEKKMRDQKCKQYTITRLKGWGECDAEDLSALCVSPKTRKLIQMKWDDETMETLEQTMAGDSEFRKILLDVK
jgi:DNA gyrase subunit B